MQNPSFSCSAIARLLSPLTSRLTFSCENQNIGKHYKYQSRDMNQTRYHAETRDIRKRAERIESDAVQEISRETVSAAAEKK